MISEDRLEQLALQWFQDTGWSYASGIQISPEASASERSGFRSVVLKARLAAAVKRFNPKLPRHRDEETAAARLREGRQSG